MADNSNQNRRIDFSEFTDNDPFAELTRIMGHDPRADKSEEDFAAAGDSYEIDLEKELMGELDFDEPDTASEDHIFEAQVEESAQPFQDDPVDTVDFDMTAEDLMAGEIEPAAAFDDDTPAMEEGDYEVAQTASQDASVTGEDPFADIDFRDDEIFANEPFADEPLAEAAPEAESPEVEVAAAEPDLSFEDDFDSALERELMESGPADEPVQVDFAAPPPETWPQEPAAEARSWEPAEAVQADDELAGIDMDFGEVDVEEAEPVAFESARAPSAPHPAWEPAASDELSQPAADAAALDPEMSLEDELNALLADPMEKASAAPVAAAAAQDGWQPGVNTFGRSNFSAFAEETETPETAETPEAAEEPEAVVEEEPVAAAAETVEDDDFADIFGSDLDLDAPSEPVEAAAAAPAYIPLSTPSYAQSAAPQAAASAGWNGASAPSASYASSAPAGGAPEVETVDLEESALAVADDLDIPEVEYGAPEPARNGIYDDLESEFSDIFGDLDADDQSAASTIPASAGSTAWAAPAAAAATAGMAAAAAAPRAYAEPASETQSADAYALGEGQWQSGADIADDGFGYDDELDRSMTMADYEEERAPAPYAQRNKLMLAAAVVAGVVVIGGVGVFATSMFGGGSDGPAVVRADGDPMKVRPENPGGATVPNQNSEAYQRMSGATPEPGVEQENLITTTEEPVDVAAREAPALAPGISDGAGSETAASENGGAAGESLPGVGETAAAGPAPKAEDRIEPVAEEAGVGASDDLVAVAPRRVRTMVVRPDGSMVPREEPTPAAAQEPASSLSATPLDGATTLAPVGGATASADDGGPTVSMPDTVSVVPSQRSGEQVAVAPQQPAAAPVVQQPAASQTPPATPAAAPAAAAPAGAAASEWSMQIASQPTAESAQSTYQDLAQRYGGVLQGRGVNIVRADIEGKGTYYRVRIPATNRDEAIQLCTQYKAAGGSCFVSR